MTTEEKFLAALKGYLTEPAQLIFGNVKSVNKAKMTCEVTPLKGGASYLGVRFKMDDLEQGFYCVPAKGSMVAVGRLNKSDQATFIALMSVVDEVVFKIGTTTMVADKTGIKFNGGKLGGWVLPKPLQAKLNLIEADLNVLKGLLATLASIGANAPGSPILGSMVSPFAAYAAKVLTPTQSPEFENKTVTQ